MKHWLILFPNEYHPFIDSNIAKLSDILKDATKVIIGLIRVKLIILEGVAITGETIVAHGV